jgi:hypothetical protein
MSVATGSVYQQLVDATNDYLGPASERFIQRQVQTHLNKRPEEVTKEDVTKLIEWVRIAIALLTEDGKMVDNYVNTLTELSKS